MLKHYIVLAFRTLWRNRFHAGLNFVGLGIGISACLLIYLIVTHELSFNRAVPAGDRIYRLHSKYGETLSSLNRGVPTAVLGYVRDNFKGVEASTLFFTLTSKVATENLQEGRARKIIASDQSYFDVFPMYRWLAGDPSVLERPQSVVLTRSQMELYFGKVSPASVLGKSVVYRDSLETFVSGIVDDLPFNTDLSFTEFISVATLRSSWMKDNYESDIWNSINSDTQLFLRKMPGVPDSAWHGQLKSLSQAFSEKSRYAQYTKAVNQFNLQPLDDLHFNAGTGIFDFSDAPAHKPTLLILIVTALLLLTIAAINFINLETAQAMRRAREVSMRKVLGSTRLRLMIQFVAQGVLLTLLALIVALPLSELALRGFREFIPEGVSISPGNLWPFLMAVLVGVGVLASAYPAFLLSSLKPIAALKNQVAGLPKNSASAYLRKVLIVFQFTVAQVLIVFTLIIGSQIDFLLSKDMGFDREAVVYFYAPYWEKPGKKDVLLQEVKQMSQVVDVAMSQDVPSSNSWSSTTVQYHEKDDKQYITTYLKFGDEHYLDFYKFKLLAGSNGQPSDTVRELIINETLCRQLGFDAAEDAIGERLFYNQNFLPIVGVVADYHTQSLHKKIEPVLMANANSALNCFNIKLSSVNGDQLSGAISKLEAAWKKIYPDAPFQYEFLDETIEHFYASERRTRKLASWATGLAIFISCLGLFGLASYTTLQRTKEVGIRKVLGASITQVVTLLSRDFLSLVTIAFVVALPIAVIASRQWLTGFSYQTTPSIWIYIATLVTAIVVAFVTVGYQTIRTARRNPVESLRNE